MKKYFYAENGEKIGPLTYEELCSANISPDTLVWSEGMDDWKCAGDVEELDGLFSGDRSDVPPPVPPETTLVFQEEAPAANISDTAKRPPKSWLVESILATIFCCLPFGIAGIVYASKVEGRFMAGDYAGAEEASKQAARWTKYSFILGIIYVIIVLIYVISTGFAGF